MAKSNDAQKRKTLAVNVSDMMKKRIISGKFKVGDKLPTEPELMEFFGVGRSTVREAMRVLAQLGYVSIEQGRGTYVRTVDPIVNYQERLQVAGIKEMHEVRLVIEGPAARMAASRKTPADAAAIRKYYDGMVQACSERDLSAVIFNDVRFHVAIAKASHNSLLYDLYRGLSNQLRHSFEYQFTDIDLIEKSLPDHKMLMDAILQGRPQEAEIALNKVWAVSENE